MVSLPPQVGPTHHTPYSGSLSKGMTQYTLQTEVYKPSLLYKYFTFQMVQ